MLLTVVNPGAKFCSYCEMQVLFKGGEKKKSIIWIVQQRCIWKSAKRDFHCQITFPYCKCLLGVICYFLAYCKYKLQWFIQEGFWKKKKVYGPLSILKWDIHQELAKIQGGTRLSTQPFALVLIESKLVWTNTKGPFLARWRSASEMSARRARECKSTDVAPIAQWVCLKTAVLTSSLSWHFLQKAAGHVALSRKRCWPYRAAVTNCNPERSRASRIACLEVL